MGEKKRKREEGRKEGREALSSFIYSLKDLRKSTSKHLSVSHGRLLLFYLAYSATMANRLFFTE